MEADWLNAPALMRQELPNTNPSHAWHTGQVGSRGDTTGVPNRPVLNDAFALYSGTFKTFAKVTDGVLRSHASALQ